MWWKLLIAETWSEAPVFGQGFGYDLSTQFEREYYAGISNEFSARSPHCFFITVFARMGLVGLALFLGIVASMIKSTLQAIRGSRLDVLGAWSAAWAMLAGASFGVVLEGPMGAVVFWILFGAATGLSSSDETEPDNTTAPRTP